MAMLHCFLVKLKAPAVSNTIHKLKVEGVFEPGPVCQSAQGNDAKVLMVLFAEKLGIEEKRKWLVIELICLVPMTHSMAPSVSYYYTTSIRIVYISIYTKMSIEVSLPMSGVCLRQ